MKNIIIILIMVFCVSISSAFAERAFWTWPDGGTFDKFELYWETGGATNSDDIMPADITLTGTEYSAYVFPNFIPGTDYNISLTVWVEGVESGYSTPPFEFTAPVRKPENVQLNNNILSWTAPQGLFDGYRISYTIDGNTNTIDLNAAALSSPIPLNCGAGYSITISATYLALFSTPTDAITGSLAPCAPEGFRLE